MFNSKLTLIRISLAENSNHSQSKVDARLASLDAAPTSAPSAPTPEPMHPELEDGFENVVYPELSEVRRSDWSR